jgi:hypothetical protein
MEIALKAGTSCFVRQRCSGGIAPSDWKSGAACGGVPMAFHSLGEWKRSLFGDMAVYGMEGVRFYTRRKTAISRWTTAINSPPNLPISSSLPNLSRESTGRAAADGRHAVPAAGIPAEL